MIKISEQNNFEAIFDRMPIISTTAILVCLLLLPNSFSASSIKNIKFWTNAFIPLTLPGSTNATPTFIIQAGPYRGMSVVAGPLLPSFTGYYLTDQRTFSAVIGESSRMHHEVLIDIPTSNISSTNSVCFPTISVDSYVTGNENCKKTASSNRLVIGNTSASPDKRIFNFDYIGEANNPCPPTSPDIDWKFKVITELDPGGEGGVFKVSGVVDVFPAFEMYGTLDNGTPITIFNILPAEGKTPFDLYGAASVPIQIAPSQFRTVEFGVSKKGNWQTNDVAKRFSFSISTDRVIWTERNSLGAVLARDVSLSIISGKWKVERPNDTETLRHLGFPDSLIPSILSLNPQPSFISFTMKDGTLYAEWNGLYVIKKADGTVKEIVQPGVRPPTIFTFNRP